VRVTAGFDTGNCVNEWAIVYRGQQFYDIAVTGFSNDFRKFWRLLFYFCIASRGSSFLSLRLRLLRFSVIFYPCFPGLVPI